MLHHPIFSQGENIIPPFGDPPDYAENYLVERLAPLLTEAGVDLVINGHNHVHGHYRWNGVHYFEASMFGNSYGAYGVDAEGNPLPEPHGAEMISWHRLIGETAFAVLDTQLPTAVTSYRVRDGEIKDALETFTLPL